MADEGEINIIKEYETSLRIPLTTSKYNQLMIDHSPSLLDQYPVLYLMDNIRMSKNRIEKKKLVRRKCLIKIIYFDNNAYMIPYTRTESLEFLAAIPSNTNPNVMIVRNVIFYDNIDNEHKMRVALEENVDSTGLKHYLTAEVEYNQHVYSYYNSNKAVEDAFFNKFTELFMYDLSYIATNDLFNFNALDLTRYGSRVFKFMNESYTSSINEQIVFKLDGYKCVIAVSNGVLTYYDAMQNFCTGKSTILNNFNNIVFQGEVMEGNVIVLTDILGGFINNYDLYMPSPMEVVPFFDWLRSVEGEEPYFFNLLNQNKNTVFKVYTQKLIKDMNAECPFKTDGYIIIQNSNIFKYKIPTIDVRVLAGHLYVDGKVDPITDENFPSLTNGKIYEVQVRKNKFEILKERFERIVPSNFEQYQKHIKEVSFMRTAARASESVDCLKKLNRLKKDFVKK
ncbi:LEF-4 [Aratus pisonii nudivirus]|nr:LEF-4 [Aratus pisonii nudivirus]